MTASRCGRGFRACGLGRVLHDDARGLDALTVPVSATGAAGLLVGLGSGPTGGQAYRALVEDGSDELRAGPVVQHHWSRLLVIGRGPRLVLGIAVITVVFNAALGGVAGVGVAPVSRAGAPSRCAWAVTGSTAG